MKPRRPNSPSFGMSIPTSTCFRTTSLMPSRMSTASFSSSYGLPSRRAFIPRMISRVRTRLPVWVVRILSVLRFTYALNPLGPSSTRHGARHHPAHVPSAANGRPRWSVATGQTLQPLVDDQTPADRRDVLDAAPSGFDEELVPQDLEDRANALLAAQRQPPERRPADEHGPRAQRQRLQDVGPPPDAAIQVDLDPTADGLGHLRQGVD